MVSVLSLWLPIVLSAVFVFLASMIIHMFLGYHRGDIRKLPREDDVMAAIFGQIARVARPETSRKRWLELGCAFR